METVKDVIMLHTRKLLTELRPNELGRSGETGAELPIILEGFSRFPPTSGYLWV